jgi:hypothetical protein
MFRRKSVAHMVQGKKVESQHLVLYAQLASAADRGWHQEGQEGMLWSH